MDMPDNASVAKILLVEDEAQIAEFVVQGLTKAGYEVEHVADGVSGLKRIFQNHYDLVLLDVMLPKLSMGWSCCSNCARTATPRP